MPEQLLEMVYSFGVKFIPSGNTSFIWEGYERKLSRKYTLTSKFHG